MATQKFLDIDAIDEPIGQVQIKGQTYTVYNMTVKALLNVLSISTETDDSPGRAGEYMQRTAETLHQMIPDCPVETFLELKLHQMNALMEWTRSLGEKETEKNDQAPQAS